MNDKTNAKIIEINEKASMSCFLIKNAYSNLRDAIMAK
jgi:hypothetical protein